MKNKKRKLANPIQIATQLTYRHQMTPTKKDRLVKLERINKQKGYFE